MRTYKVIVYREVQQSTTVEVETDSWDVNEIKQKAEDATIELSDHDWKDEEAQILSSDTMLLVPDRNSREVRVVKTGEITT
jgi:hypothetical protein